MNFLILPLCLHFFLPSNCALKYFAKNFYVASQFHMLCIILCPKFIDLKHEYSFFVYCIRIYFMLFIDAFWVLHLRYNNLKYNKITTKLHNSPIIRAGFITFIYFYYSYAHQSKLTKIPKQYFLAKCI